MTDKIGRREFIEKSSPALGAGLMNIYGKWM